MSSSMVLVARQKRTVITVLRSELSHLRCLQELARESLCSTIAPQQGRGGTITLSLWFHGSLRRFMGLSRPLHGAFFVVLAWGYSQLSCTFRVLFTICTVRAVTVPFQGRPWCFNVFFIAFVRFREFWWTFMQLWCCSTIPIMTRDAFVRRQTHESCTKPQSSPAVKAFMVRTSMVYLWDLYKKELLKSYQFPWSPWGKYTIHGHWNLMETDSCPRIGELRPVIGRQPE